MKTDATPSRCRIARRACWYQEDNLLTSQDAIGRCQGIFTNTDVRNFKREGG